MTIVIGYANATIDIKAFQADRGETSILLHLADFELFTDMPTVILDNRAAAGGLVQQRCK
jgi:hypothetical protein